MYEYEDHGDTKRHIHYVRAAAGVFLTHSIIVEDGEARAPVDHYLHKDHLGSIETITDENGAIQETLKYDAWGKRLQLLPIAAGGGFVLTYELLDRVVDDVHRGYTGHEMLDLVSLVHMGGRVYDNLTGRFLSADPFVQAPENLQNSNRYSYVLNNPLSYTDPSGFFFKKIAKLFRKIAKPLSILSKVLYFVPGLQGVAFALDVAISFGNAFSGTLLAGGSLGDALKAGLKSGAITYASASVLNGLSQKYGWSGQDFARYSSREFAAKLAQKTIAHGIVGGAVEELSGGKFKHGFTSGAITAAASPIIYTSTHDLPIGDVLGTAASALVGGTVSKMGGGKFSNGAITGATGYLHNAMSDDVQSAATAAGNWLVEQIGMDASQAWMEYSAGMVDAFMGEGYFQEVVVADGAHWKVDTDSNFYLAGEGTTYVTPGINVVKGGASAHKLSRLKVGKNGLHYGGRRGAWSRAHVRTLKRNVGKGAAFGAGTAYRIYRNQDQSQ
ncbi:MAG: RHS repeat-associated core domain-containing protein [Verrucomicrobiota bacterium]